MSMHRWSSLLQIVGNLGVLVGLFFVGYQLIQDRELKTAELGFLHMDSAEKLHLSLAGEEPHKSIVKLAIAPETATEEDRYIASKVFVAILFQRRKAHLMEEAGLFKTGTGGFVDYEFGTAVGVSYLKTQLENWTIGKIKKKKYLEAIEEPDFSNRLYHHLTENLVLQDRGE
ncbi:MAG: hypothetical protein GKR90_25285 [Pseudomonadales bacterium]|nr:hypothetical protein [Pseudomonadales bacterium]